MLNLYETLYRSDNFMISTVSVLSLKHTVSVKLEAF